MASAAERFKNCVAVMDAHFRDCTDGPTRVAWMVLRRMLATPATDLLREEMEAEIGPKEYPLDHLELEDGK